MNSRYRILIHLFAASLLAPATTATGAAADETTLYDIEVVLFARTDTAAAMTELWPAPVDAEISDEARPLAAYDSAAEAEHGILALDPATHRLQAEANALRRSSRYRKLAHLAWRQQGLDRGNAPLVRIGTVPEPRNAEPPAEPGHSPLSALDRLLSNIGEESIDEPVVKEYPLLDGTIQVALSRYLHVYLDLWYNPEPENKEPDTRSATTGNRNNAVYWNAMTDVGPPAANAIIIQPREQYRLSAHRRMRSGQLHYLDHPMLGALVQIDVVEPDNKGLPAQEAPFSE